MTPEPTSLSHCKNRESQVYQQSNIDIELSLQVGMNIGAGILHDVLSPGFAFKRGNSKLIDALKEIERRVNETLRRHALDPENSVIQDVGRPPIEHNPVADRAMRKDSDRMHQPSPGTEQPDRPVCRLVAQNGHARRVGRRPLLGVKRT